MTETKTRRTRTIREPLPLDALQEVGYISSDDVPKRQRAHSGRKWAELSEKVVLAAQHGEWFAVRLDSGYSHDVVRSGLKEELKRSNLRLDWRSSRNPDGSMTLYFTATSRG